MSTDLVASPGPPPAGAESSALVLWAYEARQAHQIATSLARTNFIPASMRGRPDDITAAILAGQELGLPPMAALRAMDIISGTPALRAHAMRGLVQSAGHETELMESTETRCRMRGRRRGAEQWQTVTWTKERAERLGLTGKEQWRKQPQTMLLARATSELCRLIAADALYAMPYSAEEVSDDDGPAGIAYDSVVATEPPRRRTARRQPVDQPPPPPSPALEPPAEPTGDTPPPPDSWDEPWPATVEPAVPGGEQ